ncbi:hypothetical protein AKJ53_01700 [candidate division MSBL1 archaeon SCGC-AAA382F02]|uniref:PBP domain-containing protein n=1 Tax=candidate division MSBL1 archaeon SCGC-AAA382F02 TaxID=1698282 RepID=A0A133VHN6_9EURY|nr:hypothetical protein AKJ53_01700 [candidate division MSBL1 archaeon SCGC-AAA382F02]
MKNKNRNKKGNELKERGIGTSTLIIVGVVAIVAIAGLFALSLGPTKTLKISGSTTVRPLAKVWRDHYIQENSDMRITITGGGSGKGISDAQTGLADIGMSSSGSLIEGESGLVGHVVAYDGIIIIVNKNNPAVDNLKKVGISKSTLQKIYRDKITNWNNIPGVNINHQLNSYTRSDESGTAEAFANFLEMDQSELKGPGQKGNPGIKVGVESNQWALGFVGSAYAFEGSIEEIPVDGNNDNTLENYERVENYGHLKSHIENYPIKRGLYFVTKGTPSEAAEQFIDWCKTEGQQYVGSVRYIPIPGGKEQTNSLTIGENNPEK